MVERGGEPGGMELGSVGLGSMELGSVELGGVELGSVELGRMVERRVELGDLHGELAVDHEHRGHVQRGNVRSLIRSASRT